MPTLTAPVEWARFIRTVRFHRIQGLVWDALGSVDFEIPDQARRALSREAISIAAANLRAAAESEWLLYAFGRVDLPILFVKGLSLAALAYGTISTKSGVDIDILVDRHRLRQAIMLLQERGYRLAQPGTATNLPKWHDLRKESTWTRSDPALQVDLHTRLADSPRLIPKIGMNAPRQFVEIAPGIALPTLAGDELFAYIAVHGASSAWFRLKWISDFAALIHDQPPEELERLYWRSQELGAGRAAAQALLLADFLYQSLQTASALKVTLLRDGRNRWLYRTALRQLAGSAEPWEPTSHIWGTAAIHYSQFFLLPGPAFKLFEFVRQARAALA